MFRIILFLWFIVISGCSSKTDNEIKDVEVIVEDVAKLKEDASSKSLS